MTEMARKRAARSSPLHNRASWAVERVPKTLATMVPRLTKLRPAVAIVVGVALGLGGAHATALGILSLVPWGLVAIALGWRVAWPDAALAGSLYGFMLALTFMTSVYTGADPVTRKLPGFIVLGLVGAMCGGVLATASSWASRRVRASE